MTRYKTDLKIFQERRHPGTAVSFDMNLHFLSHIKNVKIFIYKLFYRNNNKPSFEYITNVLED